MAIGPVVPGDVPWVYWALAGGEFPQGNEDDMRAEATAHADFAAGVAGVLTDLQVSAASLYNSVQSDAVENFDAYLKTLETYLGQIRDQAAELARLLDDGALNLEFTKIAINVQVVLSAAEIVLALILAIPSLGASLAEIPVIVAIGQFLVRALLGRLDLSVVLAVLPNLIAQGYQIGVLHTRGGLDLGSLGISAAAGAVAGLVTWPVEGALTRFAGPALTTMFNQRVSRVAVSAASAGTANAAVNAGVWELNNAVDPAANAGKPLSKALTSGFASGAALGTAMGVAGEIGGRITLGRAVTAPPVTGGTGPVDPTPRALLFTADDPNNPGRQTQFVARTADGTAWTVSTRDGGTLGTASYDKGVLTLDQNGGVIDLNGRKVQVFGLGGNDSRAVVAGGA